MRAWWYKLALPKNEGTTLTDNYLGEWDTGFEWHTLPKDIYEHKIYPICPKCRNKFVPIRNYKRCFKCRFLVD